MAPKKTAMQKKEAAKARELRNPFTGEAPNSFTKATNRELPAPRNVRDVVIDRPLQSRTRRAADAHLRSRNTAEFVRNPAGDGSAEPVGYQVDDTIHPDYHTFVQGARHMLPNTAARRNVPAINEPHEADPGVTVQRRAEDLSGKEVRKGEAALKQYGHDPKDPMGSLKEAQRRALNHGIAMNIAAGVEESSSQMFYGGTPNTNLDHDLPNMERHETGVMAANDRFHQAAAEFSEHPKVQDAMSHLPARARRDASVRITAQSVADNSPNAKWRDKKSDGSDAKYPWPNIQQAEESNKAALADHPGEPVKFIAGRVPNPEKARDRVRETLYDEPNFEVHQYGDHVTAAKTVSFRGALVDKDAADAFKVTDVHEASRIAPWLDTAKGIKHERTDDEGNRVGPYQYTYKDTPAKDKKGLTPVTKAVTRNGVQTTVPERGLSRPEAMVNQGASTVHALNDRATREVLAERGLSRGVEYADNVHSAQGLTWGLQQVLRKDVSISPADQHPVVRDWESEGVNVPENRDIRNLPAGGNTNLSRQFAQNTRTGFQQTPWPEDRR